jgi:hypothetical protein
MFIADDNLPSKNLREKIPIDKYYEISRRSVQRSSKNFDLDQISNDVYA